MGRIDHSDWQFSRGDTEDRTNVAGARSGRTRTNCVSSAGDIAGGNGPNSSPEKDNPVRTMVREEGGREDSINERTKNDETLRCVMQGYVKVLSAPMERQYRDGGIS